MDNNQLIQDYSYGKSLAQCSKDYNLDIPTIKKLLKINHIHIRNRAEQNIYTNASRAYSVNHLYFDELNLINVYYIGFFAADGYVPEKRNTLDISLSAVDKEWLFELKDNIQSKAPVREHTTNKGFQIASFAFSSKHILDRLKEFGIVNRKTYIGSSMKNIPNELKLAYIKGFFDGDGSFSWNKKTLQGTFKICSKTQDILVEFKDFLLDYFDNQFNMNIYTLHRQDKILYSLECSTIPSLMILDEMYHLRTPFLARKYKNFKAFKQFRLEKYGARAKTTL